MVLKDVVPMIKGSTALNPKQAEAKTAKGYTSSPLTSWGLVGNKVTQCMRVCIGTIFPYSLLSTSRSSTFIGMNEYTTEPQL